MFEESPNDRLAQLDAMRQGVDYHLEISCRDYVVTVRPLTMKETVEVATRVNDAILKLPEHARTRIMESTLLAKETLKLATKSDVDSADQPRLTDYIMDRMTPEELQFIHRQYVQAIDRVNPVMETLPKERLDELVGAIKKNETALTDLSFLELANVCRCLIRGD